MDLGKNIRIKDIAKLAGVSVGTVDRVLHNRGRVSPEALQKVNQVLAQIDYKPNLLARTLGSNKNYKIAAIVPDPTLDQYWAQSNLGLIQAQAEWEQYGVVIEPHFFDLTKKDQFLHIAKNAATSNPDGIVIAPIFYNESVPAFQVYQEQQIPYVLFNTQIAEVNPLSFIGQDLEQSGRVGAELASFGHAQQATFAIVHLNEDLEDSPHLLAKEKGFRQYFNEHNQTFSVISANLHTDAPGFTTSMVELLDTKNLKGVFVSTSHGTALAASLLKSHNKEHIRLVGYDILEENLIHLRSGVIDFLINQNPKRQAFLAISHLVNHLMFKKSAPETDLFPLEIISKQNVQSYLSSGIH